MLRDLEGDLASYALGGASVGDVARVSGNVLLLTALMAALLFLIVYNRYAKWRDSRFGSHIGRFMLAILLALALGAVRLFTDDSTAVWMIRAGIFLCLNYVLWMQLWILLEEQGVMTNDRAIRKRRESLVKAREAVEDLEDDGRISRQSDSSA